MRLHQPVFQFAINWGHNVNFNSMWLLYMFESLGGDSIQRIKKKSMSKCVSYTYRAEYSLHQSQTVKNLLFVDF